MYNKSNKKKYIDKKNYTDKKSKKKKTFSKKHYDSNDGMQSNVWGPALWVAIHSISFNYPVNPRKIDKIKYKNFLLNLQYTLPCKYCRINLRNNFKEYPIDDNVLKNRDSFSRYIYNLHERINDKLNKKSNLTYCQVRERYENFRSRCNYEKPKYFKFSKKEKGCTNPLYGEKSKCVINIVPAKTKCKTLKIDKKCLKRK